MQTVLSRNLLLTMYEAARASAPPSRNRLCSMLGESPDAVGRALTELERSGLASARTARLTFVGLAMAAAISAARAERAASRRCAA